MESHSKDTTVDVKGLGVKDGSASTHTHNYVVALSNIITRLNLPHGPINCAVGLERNAQHIPIRNLVVIQVVTCINLGTCMYMSPGA